MYQHGLPGILILLLYLKTAHTQQPNSLNSQQGVPPFQGNLNNPSQFSVPNSAKNVRQSQNAQQANLQEFLNSVNVESQKNTQPQMNFQQVDYQQNPSAPNANLQFLPQQKQQISQGNAGNTNSALPPQMSSLSSAPNPYSPRISSGQGIYLNVPENSGSNSIPLSVSSSCPKLSAIQNQPFYSLVPNIPQNTVSQQALLQNSVVKQNQFLESSNPSMSCQQNTRPINLIAGEPIITSIQYEPAIASSGIASVSNSPERNQFKLSSMRFQPVAPSVQASSAANQPIFNPMPFQPAVTVSQNSPTFMSPQFQPVVNSVPFAPSSINQATLASFLNQPTLRSVQVKPVVETQPDITPQIQTTLPPSQSSLMSYILSQLESSKTPKYPKTVGSKQKSKSNLKTLLPLILDVLKERQTGCGCRNCGCMNNNNNNEVSIQEPKIFGGYSNQKVYGLNDVVPISNNNDLMNSDTRRNILQKNFRQNVINTESAEESDENYSDYVDDG